MKGSYILVSNFLRKIIFCDSWNYAIDKEWSDQRSEIRDQEIKKTGNKKNNKKCRKLFSLQPGKFVISLAEDSYIRTQRGCEGCNLYVSVKDSGHREGSDIGDKITQCENFEHETSSFEIGNISHCYFSILEFEVALCAFAIATRIYVNQQIKTFSLGVSIVRSFCNFGVLFQHASIYIVKPHILCLAILSICIKIQFHCDAII